MIIKPYSTILLILLAATVTHAQPSGAADCTDGHIPSPRIDPRRPDMYCFQPWGTMTGWLAKCDAEEFGSMVVALGDINHDNLADFAVQHTRCDTVVDGQRPVEWFVYKGMRGALASAQSGERIGPGTLLSQTHILCAGDWDNDGNVDILISVHPLGDTAEQSGHHYTTARVAVLWGHTDGAFSIDDTTRLTAISDLWLKAFRAVSKDLDGDAVADLVIWGGDALQHGTIIPSAEIQFYHGHERQRWGREGISRSPDLAWWKPPPFNYLQVTDQDCDGHPDIALINQRQSNIASDVGILYGRTAQLPDTSEVEDVSLTRADGHFTLFVDVTGDRVPEMVSNSDSEVIRVFAGKPGQRLKAMYGTGNEPSPPFPGRPWLNVSLPKKVDPLDWFSSGEEPLFDLGDGNLDGITDVWTYTYGFFICYGTADAFDFYVDAGMRWGNVTSATRLGDIDGSGVASFAVGWDGAQGGLAFYHVSDSIPKTGIGIDYPHPYDFVCNKAADVVKPTHPPVVTDSASIALDVYATRDEISVNWRARDLRGNAIIILVDASGRETMRRTSSATAGRTTLETSGLPRGVYLVTIRVGTRASATKIVLE